VVLPAAIVRSPKGDGCLFWVGNTIQGKYQGTSFALPCLAASLILALHSAVLQPRRVDAFPLFQSRIEMQNTPLTNQLLIEYAGKVRELQLSPEDAALLEQEHATHPSSEALFIHPGTLKLHSPNMVRLRHNQILEKAEIPHIRFEDLRHIRHTCAILALQNVMTAAELTHLQGCCRPILTRQSYAEYMVQTQSAQKQKIASEQKHLQNEQQQATQAMDDLLGF